VLGIGGVAIGFAFRDILQNALAGMLILLTRPFRIGDQVVAGGHEGTVEDIQVRATTIRTYDNRRAVIPNTALFTDKVLVNTAFEKRRLSVRVGVGNGDDLAEAKRVVEAAARGAEGVLADPPPRALVVELGDSAVLLDVFFWIDPPKRSEAIEVTDHVLARVKPALAGAGIDIPYPTVQVLLHDQTEATDGDRTRQREGWPARGGDRDPLPRWRVRDGESPPPRPNGAADQAS
jgi:small-conductance mechanosensitive channel